MTTFESSRHVAVNNAETIFTFLSDFNKLGDVLPAERVKNWESTDSTCRFTVESLGEVGLRIEKKVPNELIQYVGDGKVPFNFYLNLHLHQGTGEQCELFLSAEAQLNPMMKMIAAGPVQKFLEIMAGAIAKHRF